MAKRDYITNPHQLDLLEKYFPVDRENKIVTIKIYYDKATDMLDFSVGELHKEMLSSEVLERITEITDKIPVDYKADIIFVIDDFCDYSPESIIEKFNDLIEINNYQIIHDNKKKCIIASILVQVGFMLLFILGIEKKYGWFNEGLAKNVLEEMMDITSWVFIWQAVTVLFLMPSDLVKIGVKFIKRIQTISISSKDEKILITEKRSRIVENFEFETKAAQFRKTALLVTSTIIFALGIYDLCNGFLSLIDNPQELEDSLLYSTLIISVIINLIVIATGLSGFLYYRGDLRVKKTLRILSILMLISLIFEIISFALIGFIQQAGSTIILFVVEILFVYCALFSQKKKKKEE